MKKPKSSPVRKVESLISLRSIILLILTSGILIAFASYLYLNADKLLELMNISSKAVFSLLVITFISMLINGLINTFLFRGLGASFSLKDGFFLAAASTLANQLPISGGMLSRGYYLKRRYNLSYAKFFSVSLALFVCFIAVNGLVGIVIMLYWIFVKHVQSSPLLLAGFSMMASFFLLFWFPLDRIEIPGGLHKWTSQAIEGWMFLSKNRTVGLKLVGLQTTMMLLLAGRYWFSFRMLSQNVSIGDVILFSSASVLTQLVSIAPGGLGITETIVGTVASLLGFDLGVSVVAVGLDRLISTPVILLIGGLSAIILGRQISDPSSAINDQP